jgi:outer membrane protein OmpA-like peptidoglycan-associated protein
LQRIISTIALVVTLTVSISAQYKNRGLTVGASFGGTCAVNESPQKPIKSQARGYLTYPLQDHLLAELGAGYAYNSGQDYLTNLIPIDLRLRYSPFSSSRLVPYVYAGFGALFVDCKTAPASVSTGTEPKLWAPHFPVGIGLECRINDMLSLNVSGGGVQSLTDELNQLRDGKKDGYWSVLAGLSITLLKTGTGDSDRDGLSDDMEEEIGTDPHNRDTDGDGLSDGEEFNIYKTSPLNADTDGDGLTDGDEVIIYRSDPLKGDTDGDGLNDGNEVFKYKTDPTKADTDGDGLTDEEEVMALATDPLKADTDGDGLTDGEEVKTYKTDPLRADTDGDGLKDGAEVKIYKTDPRKVDTDGGSVRDDVEVAQGTDPLNPNDDVRRKPELRLEVGKKIVLEGVVFEPGSAKITPASAEILDEVFWRLYENPKLRAEVQGHTDNMGSHSFNVKLSQARASAVKAYLVEKGISPKRLTTKGFGPDRPIAPNWTPEGRQKNRRVEFLPKE